MEEKKKESLKKPDILELISHWSVVFGLPMQTNKAFPSPDRIALSLKLIREELKETEEAIVFKDLKETQDGLGDLFWVVVRAMYEFGINPQETIEKIYDSNMSKADTTLEDSLLTKKQYDEKGIETYVKERQGLFITYRKEDHKVQKSYLFKSPEF